MNPFDLSASDLLVWGIVAHLIADWPLQNDWMARGKHRLGSAPSLTHQAIHTIAAMLVFGLAVGAAVGFIHAVIDTRTPVAWWSRLVRQTQPSGEGYDIGLEVRFWTDQVFHIACVAIAALVVA